MFAITNARLVLQDEILENGTLVMERDRILAIGRTLPVPAGCPVLDAKGRLAGPGFVDLHCHAGGAFFAYQDPTAMAKHHLQGGTTALNCTIYHDIGVQGALDAMEKIRSAMEADAPGNILGVHFEGPFLNPKHGCFLELMRPVDEQEYRTYIEKYGDILRLWTVAPELPGAEAFMDAVREAGIVLAVGHSEASYECVCNAAAHGATVCTHLCDATGVTPNVSTWEGTKEVDFDTACMLQPQMFCEIINDSLGAHVRPAMTRFIVQAIGLDRVVAVTDACTGSDDGSDLNLVDGLLFGSKLKMNQAAGNFKRNTGLNDVEVFRVCSLNPARALHLEKEIGSLEPGKLANLVVVDDDYNVCQVFLKGRLAVDNDGGRDVPV